MLIGDNIASTIFLICALHNFDKWVFNLRNVRFFVGDFESWLCGFLAGNCYESCLDNGDWHICSLLLLTCWLLEQATGRETKLETWRWHVFFAEVNSRTVCVVTTLRRFSWSSFGFKAGRLSVELFFLSRASEKTVWKLLVGIKWWNVFPPSYRGGPLCEAQRNSPNEANFYTGESASDGFEARWSIHPQTQHLLTQPLGFVCCFNGVCQCFFVHFLLRYFLHTCRQYT